MAWLALALLWGVSAALSLWLPVGRVRRVMVWGWPLAGMGALLALGDRMAAWERLLLGTVGLLFAIKGAVLFKRAPAEVAGFSRAGLLLYGTIWPGMDPAAFRERGPWGTQDDAPFVRGVVGMALGLMSVAGVALALPVVPRDVAGVAGIGALLLTVHFGWAQTLPWGLQAMGWRVGPLFDRPERSVSLTEFWSRRWNRAFVEMDRLLFLRPLRRRLGARGAVIGVFAISGALHEAAISVPAWSGWGYAMGYFLLHGVLVTFERAVGVERWPSLARRAWTWGWLLVPAPWLFHAGFRESCVLPLFEGLNALLTARSLAWYFERALWLAALGHLCVLGASVQVPARLGWREDLAKLTRFNRKVFWTYGAFIVLCIVGLVILTAALHGEMVRGERAALGLAAFIGVFWLARVLVDALYFRHDDWPKGPLFVIGHALLTALFCALATTYLGLVVYHAAFRRH